MASARYFSAARPVVASVLGVVGQRTTTEHRTGAGAGRTSHRRDRHNREEAHPQLALEVHPRSMTGRSVVRFRKNLPTKAPNARTADLGQAILASGERGSSERLLRRDGSDRQANRSPRHARPVSGTASGRTIARLRSFAGVATASRSDVRSGRRLSDPAVGSTMPSPSTSGRPPRPATNQARRRPTRPTTDPAPTAPNTTPTHTQQLTNATQRQRAQPQLPTPRKQRLPSITFKA